MGARRPDDFRSLADYIAPVRERHARITSAPSPSRPGSAPRNWSEHFKKDLDDYNAIMVEALADRLAEAFAEYLHEKARRDWGFGQNEKLTKEDLIEEKYRGIRPAAGLSVVPRSHREEQALDSCCDVEANDRHDADRSFAMWPAASVSGLYFAHPEARYFAVDLITRDQVENYAKRKGMPLAEVERWLQPNLAYEAQ